jgi:hypothetical protein
MLMFLPIRLFQIDASVGIRDRAWRLAERSSGRERDHRQSSCHLKPSRQRTAKDLPVPAAPALLLLDRDHQHPEIGSIWRPDINKRSILIPDNEEPRTLANRSSQANGDGAMVEYRLDNELFTIVEEKVTSLVKQLEDADWSAGEVALAINEVIKRYWLDRAKALRAARQSLPKDLSDGNEG